MYDTLKSLVHKSEFESAIRNKVVGRKICIASRYRPGIKLDNIYSIIGYSLGSIFDICGAKVYYHHVPRDRVKPLTDNFDYCFLCYYDTDVMVKEIQPLTNSILKRCKKKFYYTNVIPIVSGFDGYLVSRHEYLDLSSNIYKKQAYSKSRENRRSFFVGRGVDTELLYPDQKEFTIIIDGSRGPSNGDTLRTSLSVLNHLSSKGYRVIPIGFNERGELTGRMSYQKVVSLYRSCHVYISCISGLYELPLIEVQSCGAHVISLKNRLHRDLLSPLTSHHFNSILDDGVLELLEGLRTSFDSSVSREFVLNGYKWTDVVGRMLPLM